MSRVLKVFDVVARVTALGVMINGRADLLDLPRTSSLGFLIDFVYAGERRMGRRARSAVSGDKRRIHETEGIRGLSGRRSAWYVLHPATGILSRSDYMRLVRAQIVAVARLEHLGRRRRAEDIHRVESCSGEEGRGRTRGSKMLVLSRRKGLGRASMGS